jgi:hypothetical protein
MPEVLEDVEEKKKKKKKPVLVVRFNQLERI